MTNRFHTKLSNRRKDQQILNKTRRKRSMNSKQNFQTEEKANRFQTKLSEKRPVNSKQNTFKQRKRPTVSKQNFETEEKTNRFQTKHSNRGKDQWIPNKTFRGKDQWTPNKTYKERKRPVDSNQIFHRQQWRASTDEERYQPSSDEANYDHLNAAPDYDHHAFHQSTWAPCGGQIRHLWGKRKEPIGSVEPSTYRVTFIQPVAKPPNMAMGCVARGSLCQ